MADLAVLDISAGLRHLEPPHVAHRFPGARQRVLYRFFEAVRRGPNQLNFFINMLRHLAIILRGSARKQLKALSMGWVGALASTRTPRCGILTSHEIRKFALQEHS